MIVLRLADGLILPLNTTQYTGDLEYYLEKYVILAFSCDLVQSD